MSTREEVECQSTREEVERQCLNKGQVETMVSYRSVCWHFLGCSFLEQARKNKTLAYPYIALYAILSLLFIGMGTGLYVTRILSGLQTTLTVLGLSLAMTAVFGVLYHRYEPMESCIPYLKLVLMAIVAFLPFFLLYIVFLLGVHWSGLLSLFAACAIYFIGLVCSFFGWEHWKSSRLTAIHEQSTVPQSSEAEYP